MTHRRRTVCLALGVIAAGISGAFYLRKPPSGVMTDRATALAEASDRLAPRHEIAPRPPSRRLAGRIEFGEDASRARAVPPSAPPVAPRSAKPRATRPPHLKSPPPTPRVTPSPPAASTSITRREAAVAPKGLPPPAAPPAARYHVIEDGDTLSFLAQRYLGNPDFFYDIFEANRDVLPSPDLLPIGAKLRIPPPRPRATVTPPRPMVPVIRSERAAARSRSPDEGPMG